MKCLVDTNVLSELARPHPDAGVLQWAAGVRRIHLSVVTLEEIAYGLAWRPNQRIGRWFDGFFETHCEVEPISAEIASHAGRLRGELRGRGQTRTQADMLIAATAALRSLTLVTRNERDFTGCAIPLHNPFA